MHPKMRNPPGKEVQECKEVFIMLGKDPEVTRGEIAFWVVWVILVSVMLFNIIFFTGCSEDESPSGDLLNSNLADGWSDVKGEYVANEQVAAAPWVFKKTADLTPAEKGTDPKGVRPHKHDNYKRHQHDYPARKDVNNDTHPWKATIYDINTTTYETNGDVRYGVGWVHRHEHGKVPEGHTHEGNFNNVHFHPRGSTLYPSPKDKQANDRANRWYKNSYYHKLHAEDTHEGVTTTDYITVNGVQMHYEDVLEIASIAQWGDHDNDPETQTVPDIDGDGAFEASDKTKYEKALAERRKARHNQND